MIQKIMYTATFAGEILLENGAEIFRVEDTIRRIGLTYKMQEVQAFATTTGIMVTMLDKDNNSYTRIIRVKKRDINLEKINLINSLSRRASMEDIDILYFQQELMRIRSKEKYPIVNRVVAAGVSAGAFAFIFAGNGYDALIAGLIALISQTMIIYFNRQQMNFFITNVIVAFYGTITSLFCFYSLNTVFSNLHPGIIIVSVMMLQTPGLAFCNAIRDTVGQDYLAGLSRIMETLFIAIAIASGSVLAYSIYSILGGTI